MIPDEDYIQTIKNWIEQFVIRMGLCPFAAKPFNEDKIRYVLCKESFTDKILLQFHAEVKRLLTLDADQLSTTLLIIPSLDHVFESYLGLYQIAQDILEEMGSSDDLQLASFHPAYQFEGVDLAHPSNYTNRSPFSIIHILREDEVERAIKYYDDPASIPERNIKTMTDLGLEEILLSLERLREPFE